MNCKTIIFTVLMTINCMSHGTERSKYQLSDHPYHIYGITFFIACGIPGFVSCGLGSLCHHIKYKHHQRSFDRNTERLTNLVDASDRLFLANLPVCIARVETDIKKSEYYKKERTQCIKATLFYGSLLGLSLAIMKCAA